MSTKLDKLIQNRAEYLCLAIKKSNTVDEHIRQLTQEDRKLIRIAIGIVQNPEKVKNYHTQLSSERVSFISKIFTGETSNSDQKDPWLGISVSQLAGEIRSLELNQIKSAVCKDGQKTAGKLKDLNTNIVKLMRDYPKVAKAQEEINSLDDKIDNYNDLIEIIAKGNKDKIKKEIASKEGQEIILELRNQGKSFSTYQELQKELNAQVSVFKKSMSRKQGEISEYKGKDIDFNNKIQKLENLKLKYVNKLRVKVDYLSRRMREKENSLSARDSKFSKIDSKIKELGIIDAFYNSILNETTVKDINKKVKQEFLFQSSNKFKDELKAIKKRISNLDEKKRNAVDNFKKELMVEQRKIQLKMWKKNGPIFDVIVSIELLKKRHLEFTDLMPLKISRKPLTTRPTAPPIEEDDFDSTAPSSSTTSSSVEPKHGMVSPLNNGEEKKFENPAVAPISVQFPTTPTSLPSQQPVPARISVQFPTIPTSLPSQQPVPAQPQKIKVAVPVPAPVKPPEQQRTPASSQSKGNKVFLGLRALSKLMAEPMSEDPVNEVEAVSEEPGNEVEADQNTPMIYHLPLNDQSTLEKSQESHNELMKRLFKPKELDAEFDEAGFDELMKFMPRK
jgi:hypothetical protein